jgi:cytochrome d ubiquinol oxidase subunit I
MGMIDLSSALGLSALGIYIHAIAIAVSIGGGTALVVFEFLGIRFKEDEYIRVAKLLSRVIVVVFAFGAATGTLVEFGLVQLWNGIILAISSIAFIPLYMELLAFIIEGGLVIALLYTWDKFRNPWIHWLISLAYLIGALLSGALIMLVNSWLQVPWGTGDLIKSIYPWAPVYGPNVFNEEFLLEIKDIFLKSILVGSTGASYVNPEIFSGLVEKYGPLVMDPWIAFYNPYAIISVVHQLVATMTVGVSWVLAGISYKMLRSGGEKYSKAFKVVSILAGSLLILQGLNGHIMGENVLLYQPTKFAMIEGLVESGPSPLVGLTVYQDPGHIFMGFDKLIEMAENHPNPDVTLGGISLREIAIRDTQIALSKLRLVYPLYTIKISLAIIGGLVSLLFIFQSIVLRRLRISDKIIYYLGLLFGFLTPTISALGWAVREIGRKPWTVYGLLYPEELISPLTLPTYTLVILVLTLIVILIIMVYSVYVVLTRPPKILSTG